MALMHARETAMRSFRPILAGHDLTEQQWRVLRALADRDTPADVGDLIDATVLLGPSLSRILANLDDRNLIDRRAAPDDQRRAAISLSSAGRALVDRVGPESEAAYARIERRYGHERLALLHDLLAEFAALEADKEAHPT